MTRHRTGGFGRAFRPGLRSGPLLAVLVALFVSACAIPNAAESTAPASTASAPASVEPTTAATDEPTGTIDPGPTELPPPSDEPTDEPTPSVEPSGSAAIGPAAACAGNDDNRDFFAAVADSVDWAVYCPVLGKGWFVVAGQYRLRGGGWMEIAYRGPSGARLEFREGAACTTDGCVPSGTELGEAAFGDLTGTLFEDGDRLAIVVDGGATPSWTLVGTGLDQAAFEGIAADLAIVGG